MVVAFTLSTQTVPDLIPDFPMNPILLADLTGLWAMVGQIGVVVAIVGGVIRIIAHIRNPKEKIECLVVQQHFALPFRVPQLLNVYKASVVAALALDIKDAFSIPGEHAFLQGWQGGVASRMESCESLWRIRVDNLGTKKCTGVKLRVPAGIIARQIVRGKTTEVSASAEENIPIGDLGPRESVFVYVWAYFRPSESDNFGVTLTHDFGVGAVRGRYLTGSVAARIGNNPGGCVWLLIIALVCMTLLGGAIYAFVKASRLSGSAGSGVAPTSEATSVMPPVVKPSPTP